jgi:chromosome segregation protein
MRLTHIKLAGFKSFVDPTTIHVPGQLIGVVGPNGCGKSNVIDAVRWVLGESSAKHLRGETMQDVLFNGSGGRNPVSRASVELVFNNSLGRAGGQWSAYAEVSVKRVLDRNGDSTYSINNQHVRRRDVMDMFLGTGVGARAYAIIEQGMISRVIDAKPEELRVFLEEAAGISIYKERRRETENRLRDTRENLSRVEDIRIELGRQLERLSAQAEVAKQYHALHEQMTAAQHMLWFLKKREAQAQWEKATREVERLVNELEAETARLRDAESRLETARASHYTATDLLHAVQSEVYAANADVAKIEQQIQHQRDSRNRITQQIAALENQLTQHQTQRAQASEQLADWREQLEAAEKAAAQTNTTAVEQRQQLPAAQTAFDATQSRNAELQRQLAEAEQSRRVEETHYAHAEKALEQYRARLTRLQHEQAQLMRPDSAQLAAQQAQLVELTGRLDTTRKHYTEKHQHQPDTERALREASRKVQEHLQHLARLEARVQTLTQMQRDLDQDEKLKAWLAKHQLASLTRLWQNLEIEAGWDIALEGVLRDRVNAVVVSDFHTDWMNDTPPAAITVVDGSSGSLASSASGGLTPLAHYVRWRGQGGACVADWLHGVYAVADCSEALTRRGELKPGEFIVCQAGHVVTSHSVSFHGEQSPLHSVLMRQREIESLQIEIQTGKAAQGSLEAEVTRTEEQLANLKTELAAGQAEINRMQQELHKVQMETQRLAQLEQQAMQRGGAIERETGEVTAGIASEEANRTRIGENLKTQRVAIEALLQSLHAAKIVREEATSALNRQRESLAAAERAAQEAAFNARAAQAKIQELENIARLAEEGLTRVGSEKERLAQENTVLDEAPLKLALDQALATRQTVDQKLAAARDVLALAAQTLQAVEQERLLSEQRHDPMRDKLEQTRLKEQETRLANEQAATQLQEAGADVEALALLAEKSAKADHLQREINRLKQEIEALGAVNLAALDELQAASERKQYLDAQSADLLQAVETLDDAIRKIDRETRTRLQETYDTVNGYFKELFPSIFGGGHAELVLTGEEILDAGVQIIAQPPGKRNNSIHLLSGGEKALTALALVFSLFRLNPAPFCLLDEVDAPLDDANTERYCDLVKKMSEHTQFMFVTHNKITMEMAQQLIGVTMPESGVSRIVAVDVDDALKMQEQAVA